MRKALNRLLKKFGYEIVRVSRFAELLRNCQQQSSDFSFVQIGANDGIRFDNLYFFVTQHPCRGLVIEPLPDVYERLAANYRDFPKIIPVRTAVHPTERKCTLYRVDPSRLSGLPQWTAGIASLNPDHYKQSKLPSALILQEQVDAMPLMQVIESAGLDHVDYLQTDTEGFDLEVLKMIDFEKTSPSLIKYEHSTLSAPDRLSAEGLLQERGYRLFREFGDTIAYLQK